MAVSICPDSRSATEPPAQLTGELCTHTIEPEEVAVRLNRIAGSPGRLASSQAFCGELAAIAPTVSWDGALQGFSAVGKAVHSGSRAQGSLPPVSPS